MNIIRRPSGLAQYRPRSIDDQFGRLVENMFEDMLSPFGAQGMPQWSAEGIATPRLNVTETEKTFEVEAEMPGVKKEDIKVSVEHQRVTIEGESKRETERKEGENVVYSERSASKYMRSFTLPSDVDEATAQAHLENGVLTLTLPKKQAGAATKLTVQ
ncbi:MAG: Hsp20/alpha crystallin family protein [Telluria sp.]